MMTNGDALVVMTKFPSAGESKTRLVPPLTYEEAAELARALLLDQLESLISFSGLRVYVAFAPANAAAAMERIVPAQFTLFPQRGGDLGERMANAFFDLFDEGCRRVVLIGSDLPVLPQEIFATAFHNLEGESPRVVLGPSIDGGYYLVGVNQPLPAIFEQIVWSRPDVLERTQERLSMLQIPYKLLASWYDIDTIDDLQRMTSKASSTVSESMNNTLHLLRQFRQKGIL